MQGVCNILKCVHVHTVGIQTADYNNKQPTNFNLKFHYIFNNNVNPACVFRHLTDSHTQPN